MKAQSLIFTFIIAGLFVVSMLNFGFYMAIENNATNTILDNPTINRSFVSINTQLSDSSTTVNASKTGFESESIKEDASDIVLPSIKSVGTTFFGIMTAMFNIIFIMAGSILNIPSTVLVTFGILLGISIVFLAWKLYRTGQ